MKPLCLPQTNWKELIAQSQSVLGYSPTRGLDNSNILKHSEPTAILACMDFENNPQAALKKRELYKHFFISFIGELYLDEILQITKYTRLDIYHKGSHHTRLAIVSGTLDSWFDAIHIGCKNEAEELFRRVMNTIYNEFCMLGFKTVIAGRKKEHADGTFILI